MRAEVVFKDKKGITEMGLYKHEKKLQKTIRNAENILSQMQQKIIRRYPMLSYAFHYVEFIPVKEELYLETDGKKIFYSPNTVLRMVKQRKMHELEYNCMHILAHGMLGHFEMAWEYEKSCVMHTLMDIEVYRFLRQLEPNNFVKYIGINSQIDVNFLEDNRSILAIYKDVLRSSEKKRNLLRARKEFQVDDHKVWYRNRKFKALVELPDFKNTDLTASSNSSCNGEVWSEIRGEMFGRNSKGTRNTGKYLKGKLTGSDDRAGTGTGSKEMGNVAYAGDKDSLDYVDMFKKFFKNREQSRENVDSIDKALYSWGFDTYGDIAFIEPEIEANVNLLDTVVLAIDTSGSCQDEVMERFMSETKGLFSKLKDIYINKLVVIQCDDEIRRIDVYKNTEEIPDADYFSNGVSISGLGGTDFNPVFDYVDELVEKGEKVDCLIYLSDGYGNFPDNDKHKYTTFFVLDRSYEYDFIGVEDDWGVIPKWIHKVYLSA